MPGFHQRPPVADDEYEPDETAYGGSLYCPPPDIGANLSYQRTLWDQRPAAPRNFSLSIREERRESLFDTVGGSLWLLRWLKEHPDVEWLDERVASIGLGYNVMFFTTCRLADDPFTKQFFRRNSSWDLWMPDVLREARWVRWMDLPTFTGIARRVLDRWAKRGHFRQQARMFHAAYCTPIEDVIQFVWWERVKKWTNRVFDYDEAQALLRFFDPETIADYVMLWRQTHGKELF